MSHRSSSFRPACLLIGAIAAGMCAGAAGLLEVDGITRTRGIPFLGARLVILDGSGATEVIEVGLEHFQRSLPLGSTFLFEYTREGCVTKQLYFDTNVPVDALAPEPYLFPFELTLEPPPPGQHFEYAGPVGYIRYHAELNDFAYDKDYSRRVDPAMVERMRGVQRTLAITMGGAILPIHTNETAVTVEPATPEEMMLVDGARARLAVDAPLVHPTGSRRMERLERLPVRKTVLSMAPHPIALPIAAMDAIPERSPPPMNTSRSEDVIVERLRVTRIIRLTHAGCTSEYRRVEHHFGAVYYFKDGKSCTQWLFDQETAD